eukprot:Blabericola_migrator_1__8097@NODE_416_length_8706_cov_42_211136_g328_i0_p7_GENE_NODE_416_length_8706_cov_42_211136_g328_i0NODE_416_length_8706_cov_42_211136_g328_i0_p7_ORF_typecomplete_len164_score42_26GcrA/PF07750_11/1e04GcrA/PF07750_11/0_035NuiA/PF07924_11/0_14MMR1/PF08505_10/0_3Lin8/PF03353_15/0_32RBM39linker/PF15519_6/0_62DUF3295/PF11702_8/0_9Caps_synth_GfcC/PF06251_11/1_1Pex14_N/PF04695_13/3_5Tristanin_u2/PF16638_5/45DUF4834/PF16118_5/8_4e03DUF4834/PF16118_5/1_2_NODE_416_length_8706_cov_42_
MVLDLYYSWYMILKVGGSGWEGMPATELPGWEKYIKQKKERERARARARGDIWDEDEEDLEGGGQPQFPMELLQSMLQQHDGQVGSAELLSALQHADLSEAERNQLMGLIQRLQTSQQQAPPQQQQHHQQQQQRQPLQQQLRPNAIPINTSTPLTTPNAPESD